MMKRLGINTKRILAAGLCLMCFLSGCAGESKEAVSKNIELLEPVNTVAEYEKASYRNLYDADIYSASVLPYVEEYAFARDEKFAGYGALPGEGVKNKETLVYSDSESLEKQIESMEERLEAMDEEYTEYVENLAEEWEETKPKLDFNKTIYDNCLKNKPAPYVADENLSQEEQDAAYAQWQYLYGLWESQTHEWEGKYRKLAHSINMQEKALAQKTALYQLDRAYYVKQLERVKEQRKDGSIIADMKGDVVAISDLAYGNNVSKETPIIAVGDMDTKVLKCNYINSTVISGAKEVYAFIDGKQYEVEYQEISSEKYTELTAAGETVYSTFYLKDEKDEVAIGDFAVIVVVGKRMENVLSVPKEAIHKDETGYYVYVLEGNETVYTYVETGMSDGFYTEIESGLAEGQKVLITTARQYGNNRATVQKGSFNSSFEGSGYMYYPSSRMLQNPIEYGTVYFGELLVSQYQHVEEGDVIATVRVQGNELELERQETKLQRLQERLADYMEQNAEDTSEAVLENIASRQEAIEDVKELIAEMKEDAATTEIRADRTGVIIWATYHEKEDIIYYNEDLLQIADEETCYVIVENTNQLLNYGNEVNISYEDREGNAKSAYGTVATISAAGVTGAFKAINAQYSMILLPTEVIADMAYATPAWGGWWNRNRYTVSAAIREMDNVLVVPKSAVTEIAGNTYVDVVDENGNITTCSFIAGGFDSKNYWVIEGLSEGMNVCLK